MPSQVTVAAKGPLPGRSRRSGTSIGALPGQITNRVGSFRQTPMAPKVLRRARRLPFIRTFDHGGLDLYTPMFAPCLLGRPGTGRQNTVLTPLPLAWLRCSSACHSIPVTQVFKKVSLSSGLLICGPETAGCRLYRYISAIWLLLLMPRNVPGTPRKRTDLAWPSIRHARRDGRRSGPPRAERQPPHAVPHVSRSATGRATRR